MKANGKLRYDKTLSIEKRVETGSFYTPTSLSEYMVKMSLSQILAEFSHLSVHILWQSLNNKRMLESDIFQKMKTFLTTYKLLDPCAGSGAFPLAYFEVLAQWATFQGLEEKAVKSWIQQLIPNFYVIDIQNEPLLLYQAELRTLYGYKSKQIPAFCLDAIDTQALEGEPRLWKQFKKGFDHIFCNPPYLGEKNHKELFQQIRLNAFGAHFYEGKMDYFYYFIYRGLSALKPSGYLCYVTTNYFATADGAKKLRQTLRLEGQFVNLTNFNDTTLFKDALGQHNIVYLYQKNESAVPSKKTVTLIYPKYKHMVFSDLEDLHEGTLENSKWHYEETCHENLFDLAGNLHTMPMANHKEILKCIQTSGEKLRDTLGEHFFVQQGIVSGFDRDFKNQTGVFVLTQDELMQKKELQVYSQPFFKNKQIRKYRVLKPAHYHILYIQGTLEEISSKTGALYEHLKPYQERLEKRREVIKGIRPWYALQWPREAWRFNGPLIAVPQRAFVNVFAFEKEAVYGSADIYYISAKLRDEHLLERTLFTVSYLNSRLVYYWLSLKGKRKGSMLELYASPLKEIPILTYDEKDPRHQKIVTMTQQLLCAIESQNTLPSLESQYLESIEQQWASLFDLSEEHYQFIQRFYSDFGAKEHESAYWEL